MRHLTLTIMLAFASLVLHAEHSYTLRTKLSGDQDHQYIANSHIELLSGFQSEPRNGHETMLDIDIYGVFPPQGGLTGGPQPGDNGVVGTLGGSLDVSLLGGAIYNIPIELPEGLGGMKPQLGICYNSQGKNGLLGWGWDLCGISSITRTGSTFYHDGYVSAIDYAHDRFSLDGQRLMMVNGNNYGGDGTTYRTEQDQMSNILSYHESGVVGTSYFKVFAANGTIYYYGNSQDSKALRNTLGYINLWLLKKIEDRYGNTIEYHYQNEPDGYRLASITYSGNNNDQIDPAFTVEFQYETREDVETSYAGNVLHRRESLLNGITVRNGYDEMYAYQFTYQKPAPNNGYPYHLLKEIHFQSGDEKLNPTRIQWGNNNYNHLSSADLKMNVTTNGISDAFLHAVKFSGDFNGDGYTDVIVTSPNAAGTYTTAQVFINKGVSGDHLVFDYYRSFDLDQDVHWIYVADFDGDGLDDLLFSNRIRNFFPIPDVLTAEIYLTRISINNLLDFIHYHTPNKNISNEVNEAILIGDFLGEGKNSFLIQSSINGQELEDSFYFTYDPTEDRFVCQSFGEHLTATRFFLGDYNGDGRTEILYKNRNGATNISQLQAFNGTYQYAELSSTNTYSWDDGFPGDFNGDGVTDMLFYTAGTITPWSIVLSNKTGGLCQNPYILPPSFPYSDPGNYHFTLDQPHHTSHYLKTGDFDGNGCADIALYNEGLFHVYYGPLRSTGSDAPFANSQRITATAFNQYDNMGLCLGNFLGKEYYSFLGPSTVSRLPNMNLRHEVRRLTDGLGRITELQYDYLMPKPDAPSENDFYRMIPTSYQIHRGIYCTYVPIRALKSFTTYNLKGKPITTRCFYEGAMVHKKGKGFLGFSKTKQEDLCNGLLQRKTIRIFDVEPVEDVIYSTMQEESVFDKNDILLAKSTYANLTYINIGNPRIFFPVFDKTSEEYDPDHPERLIKKEIHETTVDLHSNHNYKYENLVSIISTIKGTTSKANIVSAGFCEFQEANSFTYAPNDFTNWLINRPLQMTATASRIGDDENVCHQTSITYDNNKPYQVKYILDIPNNGSHPEDKLVLKTEYQYDLTGNIISKTISTPNDSNPSKRELFEYSKVYGRRLLTKHTNAAGHEFTYGYHPVYNQLLESTDANGLHTRYEQDPLGVTKTIRHPDGTISCKITRWNNGDYFQWEKKTGQQTKMTYYASTGELTGSLTFDLLGDLVFTDIAYDDFGRVSRKTAPYRLGETILNTQYEYDSHNRVKRITHSDGTYETISYDGNLRSTSYYTLEGLSQTESKTVNVMGWTIKTTDTGGQSVIFDHYADGMPKSYQIEGYDETLIEMSYDARRNRSSLLDPNYGLTTSEYNGFGELVTQVSPKSDRTCFEYDFLGNPVKRTEIEHQTGESTITEWIYGQKEGQYGLLLKTSTDNQNVQYEYDELLRLKKTTDSRDNGDYLTCYEYDDASRISRITYPSSYTVQYCYTSEGQLNRVLDNNGKTLWRTLNTNASGQITDYQTGNGFVTSQTYDNHTHRLLSIQTTRQGKLIQDYGYTYDGFSNMTSKEDRLTSQHDLFTYDPFNRLTSSTNAKGCSSYVYDPLGRMVSKTGPTGTVFSQADYTGPMPHALKSAQTASGVFPNESMTISYTPFDKVSTIQEGDNEVHFEYGFNQQRIKTHERIQGKNRVKTYVNQCEFVDIQEEEPRVWTFLTGPTGVFAVVETLHDHSEVYYIHKDHLGSWTLISDSRGKMEQANTFDAWGLCSNHDSLLFDRGFTGHEHIKGLGLINMNGRLYDPVTSSMLSPDNNIQMPDLSQNLNRYAYCVNNPLTYTDPDGNSFIESALIFYILYCTDLGYEYQKHTGFFAFHFDLHLSSQQMGIGFDVSLGLPKSWTLSARCHLGLTYYWNYYDNSYSGWEFRAGLELYTGKGFIGYSSTYFHQRNMSQVTNAIVIGNYLCNFTYENDYMFHIADGILGKLAADNGDRYRTAAARLRFGIFSIGLNIFTGDPGLDHEDRETFFDPDAGGRETYKTNANGDDPDKYRAGVLYVGIGPIKIGANSEQIRHFFQNRFAHDFLCGGDTPYFKVLDRPSQTYFYFGTETGNTLW